MSDQNKNNVWDLELDVDVDDLVKSLNHAEEAFNDYSKSAEEAEAALDDFILTNVKAGNEAREALDALTDEEKQVVVNSEKKKRAIKEEVEVSSKAEKKQSKILSGIRSHIDREKSALEELGISWGNLSALIGGAAFIGIIYKAAKDFMEFDSHIRSLNTSMGDTPKLAAAASGSIQGLTGYLGMTRDELVTINQQIGDLKLIKANTVGGQKALLGLTKDVIHLSKSMNVGTSSVIGLYDQFSRVYKLPHNKIRQLSASMKFLQETTSITGDEIMSFAEGLEDVLARMTGTSKGMKVQVTEDMMAAAAVFKDAGIKAESVQGLFSHALDRDSEQGAQWLAFITKNTGKTIEQMRQQISKGDVLTPMEMMIDQLKKVGPKALELNAKYYEEMTGMSYAEMVNMMQMDKDTLRSKIDANRKAAKDAELHKKRAEALEAPITAAWNRLKRMFEQAWLKFGKFIITIAEKASKFIIPMLEKVAIYFDQFIDWVTSPQGAKKINQWFTDAGKFIKDKFIPALKGIWEFLVKIAEYGKKAFEWFQGLSGTEKTLLGIGAGLALISPKIITLGGALISAFKGMQGLNLAALINPWTAGLLAAAAAGWALGEAFASISRRGSELDSQIQQSKLKNASAKNQQASNERLLKEAEKLGYSNKTETAERLSALMTDGVIDQSGKVIYNPDKMSPGYAKALQGRINSALSLHEKTYGKGTMASLLKEAASKANAHQSNLAKAPVVTEGPGGPGFLKRKEVKRVSKPAKVSPVAKESGGPAKVEASTPGLELLLAEIRDTVNNISIKMVTGPGHPAQGSVDAALGF